MNLMSLLARRVEEKGPVRVGLIGAGKFGSMFLGQVPTTPGLEVSAIADLSVERAKDQCRNVGWDDARLAATDFLEDGKALAARDDVDVVVEATGHPAAGIAHALCAFDNGKHAVMVNVEADVLAGAALNRRAQSAGEKLRGCPSSSCIRLKSRLKLRAASIACTRGGPSPKSPKSVHSVAPSTRSRPKRTSEQSSTVTSLPWLSSCSCRSVAAKLEP